MFLSGKRKNPRLLEEIVTPLSLCYGTKTKKFVFFFIFDKNPDNWFISGDNQSDFIFRKNLL